VSRVVEPVEAFVVDRKGANGEQRAKIKEWAQTLGVEFVTV
jgi:D-tyrosyl-tRNA(Tyr) deacylase